MTRDKTWDVGPVHTLEPCDCGGTVHNFFTGDGVPAVRFRRHHYHCTEDCPHEEHRAYDPDIYAQMVIHEESPPPHPDHRKDAT